MRKTIYLRLITLHICITYGLLTLYAKEESQKFNKMLDFGIELNKNADYIAAIDTLNATIQLYDSLQLNEEDKLLLLYIYLDESYFEIGDYKHSLLSLEKAENIAINLNKSIEYITKYIYYNRAITYSYIGEHKKAVLLLENVLKQIDDPNFKLKVNHELGVSFYKIQDYKNAIQYFETILKYSKKEIPNIEYTLNYCALAYEQLKNYSLAEKYFEKSLKICVKKYPNNHDIVALAYENIGRFYANSLNLEKGLTYLKKALQIYLDTVGEDHYFTKSCNYKIGNYFLQNNHLDSALHYYQKALLPADTNYFNNPELDNQLADQEFLDLLMNKARALERKAKETEPVAHLQAAHETLQLALQAVERLKMYYQFEESRLNLGKTEREILEQNFKLVVQLFERTGEDPYKEQALILSDQMKYITLMASLQEQQAMESVIPEALKAEEKKVNLQIASYRKTLMNEQNDASPDSSLMDYAEEQLFDLYLRQDSLKKVFENRYPGYYQMKYREQSIDIQAIQQSLSKDQSVVSYGLSDSVLYTFVIEPDDIIFVKNQADEALFQALKDYQQSIYGMVLDIPLYRSAAYTLYEKLVAPVQDHLAQKVMVVPDQSIGYISFDALLQKPTRDRNPKKWAYLIYDHTFSYAFSLAHYMQTTGKEYTGSNRALAMAPSYPDQSPFLDISPDTRNEVNSVNNYFGADTFMMGHAHIDTFKSRAAQYNMAHLAAHGVVDTNNQTSALVFHPGIDVSSNLYDYEISQMRLPFSLVVLSACNTGDGRVIKGEGIMSLGRSFMAAGSQAVVLSLWVSFSDVDEVIYDDFYRYLSRGYDKSSALRKAKLNYIKQAGPADASPRQWAGHILIGDPAPVVEKNRRWVVYGLIVVGGLVLMLLVMWFWKFRRK